MSGHTPMPETVAATQKPVVVPQQSKAVPATAKITDPHWLIRQLCGISRRRTLKDNLPFLAKPDGGRNVLGTIFAQLGYTVGAEVGTKKGDFAKILCEANPGLHLYCVDAWSAAFGGEQSTHDRYFRRAQANLNGHNVTFVKKPSMEALPDFKDGSLDFVYIDANHQFDYACPDLIFWSQKVRSGGIVSGHDYFRHYRGGVVEAVDAYTRCHHIDPWYVTLELWPSFFWVKP